MSFQLKRGERVSEGVRRIVRERIDRALKSLDDGNGKVSDAGIHEARRRLKEIRATLRLVRDDLGAGVFDRENRAFRDLARPLSKVRDAKVLVDSLDGLIAHFEARIALDRFAGFREMLVSRQRVIRKEAIRHLPHIARRIRTAKKRIKKWPLRRRAWSAIDAGLQRVCSQGRHAMKQVTVETTDSALHEWRKRAKDLRYELELLQFARPNTMNALAERAHKLTDLLGEDHDLAVLRTAANAESKRCAFDESESLIALIDERRDDLQRESIALGQVVYGEKPKAFVHRIKGFWKTPQWELTSPTALSRISSTTREPADTDTETLADPAQQLPDLHITRSA